MISMDEGSEAQEKWSMYCSVATLAALMMARMEQLPLELGILQKAVIRQALTTPQRFSKRTLLSSLHIKILPQGCPLIQS